MTSYSERALLPEGLRDDLAPDAEFEAGLIDGLVAAFARHGYDRVEPPLLEFEESLLAGPAADRTAMFRLLDPASQRMMAIRADMTVQVARVATTRLRDAPRPLRLSYAGRVLRVRGSQFRPEREFSQIGVELIGEGTGLAGELEVLLLAAEALETAGIMGLSFDLTLPRFVIRVAADIGLEEDVASAVREALDGRDLGALEATLPEAGEPGRLFRDLLLAAGPAEKAISGLRALPLTEARLAEIAHVEALAKALAAERPALTVTLDPVEFRGFEYHTGVGFSIFARGARAELGRGGRYRVGGDDSLEAAVGFTIYGDSLLETLSRPANPSRLYLPHGTSRRDGDRLRGEGWRTVAGLAREEGAAGPEAEARRLLCSHIFRNGSVARLA